MERVTITDGTNRLWTFPQKYLAKYSRFYQDMCHDTGDVVRELILPNILSDINPDFEGLQTMMEQYLLASDYQTSVIDWKYGYSIVKKQDKFKNVILLATRLDMPEFIAGLFDVCLRDLDIYPHIIKYLYTDEYLFNCCIECVEPLQIIETMLEKPTMEVLLFIQKNKTKIINSQKKYTGKKYRTMLEFAHHGYFLQVVTILPDELIPITDKDRAHQYLEKHPISTPIDDDNLSTWLMVQKVAFNGRMILSYIFIRVYPDEESEYLYDAYSPDTKTVWSSTSRSKMLFVPKSIQPDVCWITINHQSDVVYDL